MANRKKITSKLTELTIEEMGAKHPDYYAAYQWHRDNGGKGKKWKNATQMINSYYQATGSNKKAVSPTKAKEDALYNVLEGQGTGVTNITNKELSTLTGQSTSTVKRGMDSLREEGRISTDHTPVKGSDGKLRRERDTTVSGQEQRRFSQKQNKELAKPENHRVRKEGGEVILERKVDGKWERNMANKEFKSTKDAQDMANVAVAIAKQKSGQPITGKERRLLSVETTADGKKPFARKDIDKANRKAGVKKPKTKSITSEKPKDETNTIDTPYNRDPFNPNSNGNTQRITYDPKTRKYVELKDGATKVMPDGKTWVFNGKTRRWNIKD